MSGGGGDYQRILTHPSGQPAGWNACRTGFGNRSEEFCCTVSNGCIPLRPTLADFRSVTSPNRTCQVFGSAFAAAVVVVKTHYLKGDVNHIPSLLSTEKMSHIVAGRISIEVRFAFQIPSPGRSSFLVDLPPSSADRTQLTIFEDKQSH